MNRNPSALLCAASLGAFALVAGCTSDVTGSGSVAFTVSRDPPPNEHAPTGATRDDPGNTREDPGNDRQDPGSDRDHPGAGAGTGSGHAGACPACDTAYACTGSGNGRNGSATFTLATKKGLCVLTALDFVFSCDGSYYSTDKGVAGGTWTPYGNGGFAISRPGLFVQCVPVGPATTGSSSGTSSSGTGSSG